MQRQHRLLLINRLCEGFTIRPDQAEEQLRDPDQKALLILEQRGYEAAKRAFDSAKNIITDLEAWKGNPMMTLVETHTVELREARRAALEAEQKRAALAIEANE